MSGGWGQGEMGRGRAGERMKGGRGGTMLELNHPSNCMEEF